MQKKQKIILLSIISIVFSFILGEVILRIYFFSRFGSRRAIYQNCQPPLYYEHIPDIKRKNLSINSYGFRGKEISHTKSKKRILCIGDSFTYGMRLKNTETIPYHLENFLGNTFEVINMGIVGYNLNQYYHLFLNKGIQIKPDIAIFFCCFNDFDDIETSSWKADFDSTLVRSDASFSYLQILLRNSLFIKYILSIFDIINKYISPTNSKFNSSSANEKIFMKISEACKKANCKYLFVLIPSKNDLNDPNSMRVVFKHILNNNSINYIKPDHMFKESLDTYYLKSEYHYNSYGCFTIAKSVKEWIVKEGHQ